MLQRSAVVEQGKVSHRAVWSCHRRDDRQQHQPTVARLASFGRVYLHEFPKFLQIGKDKFHATFDLFETPDFMAVLAGVVVFLIFAMIVIDVLMRITGFKPWTYISSTVEYGLLWFTMLAAPWLVRIN